MTRRIEHRGGKVVKHTAEDVKKQNDDAIQIATAIVGFPILAIMIYCLADVFVKNNGASALIACAVFALIAIFSWHSKSKKLAIFALVFVVLLAVISIYAFVSHA